MAAYEAQIAAMLRSILNLGHIWRTSQEDEREFFKSLQTIVGRAFWNTGWRHLRKFLTTCWWLGSWRMDPLLRQVPVEVRATTRTVRTFVSSSTMIRLILQTDIPSLVAFFCSAESFADWRELVIHVCSVQRTISCVLLLCSFPPRSRHNQAASGCVGILP